MRVWLVNSFAPNSFQGRKCFKKPFRFYIPILKTVHFISKKIRAVILKIKDADKWKTKFIIEAIGPFPEPSPSVDGREKRNK